MSKDALFQLGMVSVLLNPAQEEDREDSEVRFRHPGRKARTPLRDCIVAHRVAHRVARDATRRRVALPPISRARLHPMQDQVSHSRTPA